MDSRDPGLEFDHQRLEKLEELRAAGYPLYPPVFERLNTIAGIREHYSGAGHERSEDRVTTSGRLYTIRDHGRTIFADLGDQDDKIQIYIRKNDLGPEKFAFFTRYIERGDLIGVRGHVFRTKLGELTIWVDEIVLLAKALLPLPEKFHGLTNIEKRYRQRYVDLIVNDQSRENFRTRSRVVSLLRSYLTDRDFLEFETPILQPVYGGANARPFTTYHHYLDQNLFLRIAPELYLKRLVVGGFEKVFELARNFRNEDVDTRHNPEFSMVEIYEAYRDYHDMMALTEGIITHLVRAIHGSYVVTYGDLELDFSPPWRRLSMEEAVREYTGIDARSTDIVQLRKTALDQGIEGVEGALSWREFLFLFFENWVEEKLVQPTLVYDFPVENSPLAKMHRSKDGFTERFELFICGMEIANGFSELNDPLDQYERFRQQDERRKAGDLEAQMIDYDFITALAYGMPPTGGVGLGIDRLVMLLTNQSSIKEVILFPQMKSEQDQGSRSGEGRF
ncbi:MAG TPA: lysine--tRNA ligase [Methanoregulaceae archaeon]|nr:MAG: lysine--tRNA ligase [Methanolinea sp.]HON80783.1 lysine--tRNA ligase [Methanoregulaceae archaeon]HPD09518.1 lysine--tRNA ligase [Methanoregulaceae archaeon]HRT14691.1 lysine--tRNA ligase [Methanoregulaceae archaeon]HRU30264.1 lysine--tRNA ligase [Methanoregulaceae archaeon]